MAHTDADLIKQLLTDSGSMKLKMAESPETCAWIARAAGLLLATVTNGGTIFACGNGGSSCDAMHFCEELVARYKRDRRGIKAMHFLDPGVMTCWSNDYKYETVFERYVQTFCSPVDSLVVISTSGNSPNILRAIEAAKSKKCAVIGLSGKDGGAMRDKCDECLVVPSSATERIQEAHITVIHLWCEILEKAIVGN